VQNRHDGRADERRPAGEHLEEHRADREEIGSCIGGFARRLLGRHVARRTQHGAGTRQFERGGVVLQRRPRQAEVEHLDAMRREKHV